MNQLITQVKNAGQDFEFYPTTNEIIFALIKDIKKSYYEHNRNGLKFLDIGAGSGKVLDAVKEVLYSTYGIEKSHILMNQWRACHYVLGVDFDKVTLMDKDMDIIFCNPPYSKYQEWSEKIIKEAKKGSVIYLVIPQRWENSTLIKAQLDSVKSSFEIIGNYSFEDAEDRKARANVHLVKISIENNWKEADPFSRFFDENFAYPESNTKLPLEKEIEKFELVHGANIVETLCFLYDQRMQGLYKNYTAICQLDRELLDEFEISRAHLIESLQNKINSAKKQFWQRLFDGMETIKQRLTKNSRNKIVDKMQANTGLEFNRENVYAVVSWVIRHFNEYCDEQLVEIYEKMINYANIENYKSNQRVFKEHQFHYCNYREEEISHIKLKVGHRIVLQSCGGLNRSMFSFENGLDERAADFIGDLMTIANNLGFSPLDKRPIKGEWDDNGAREYTAKYKGEEILLFKVRAFQNRNMHFHFDPIFIQKLNIEFGRIRKWIYTPEEATKEMGIESDLAVESFGASYQLKAGQLLLK